MKKEVSMLLVITLCVSLLSAGCTKKSNSNLTSITLNEVAHSIFYAPQYAAIELGYFEEEGIDLELVTGFGADKVMTALISGDADIGFMGSESSIYVYNQGANDYAVNFAGLTQRAGNFLVSREDQSDFKWSDLEGKTVLGGRAGGMPQMVFEYILKKHGLNPTTDLNVIQNIDFGSTAPAFSSGTADYTIEFEPHATSLELEGSGYVVSSLGVESGYIPYTAYCVKKSYLDGNEAIIQGFTNAIQKGLNYVNSHSAEEIAKVIAPQFKEMDEAGISLIINRYKNQDSWKTDTIFKEENFNLLQNILEEAGQLDQRVPYKNLIITDYSEKALKEVKP